MKRWIPKFAALASLLIAMVMFAPCAHAQLGQVSGTLIGLDGQPFAGCVVTITSNSTGRVFTVTSDKDGKFIQLGIPIGIYTVVFKGNMVNYTDEGVQVKASDNQPLNLNFQEIAKKQGYDVDAAKKKEDEQKKFSNMKLHFTNGVKAVQSAEAAKQQWASAQPDQQATLKAQEAADYQTAVSEFEQAQQEAPAKDPNIPLILGNLGVAYDGAGKYPEAVDVLQKAVELKPTAGYYMQLGTDLAHVGKIPEATAACEQAATLSPTDKTIADSCYRNMGVVLVNMGQMKEALVPLQKATELNPKDADSWYLLGNALTGTIDSKTEGNKIIYIIPPGTTEAYQKYLELEPNGPHAAEAKASLQSIAQLSGGESTTINAKKKKN
jgi:tetratricopeptide (TPR) repeat protein